MVRCAKCGYLGVRHPETHGLVCPDESQRETGVPVGAGTHTIPPSKWIPLDIAPICALGVFDLRGEWRGGSGSTDAAKEVMQRDRDCSRFTHLTPGLMPKEHIDMDLLGRQQAWQDEQRRRDRAFNGAIAIVAAIVAGVMGIVGILVGAYINKPVPTPSPPAVAAPANPAAK